MDIFPNQLWGAKTPKRLGLATMVPNSILLPRKKTSLSTKDRKNRAQIAAARGRQSGRIPKLWRPLATSFTEKISRNPRRPETFGPPSASPNFESIRPRVRSLEGAKVFRFPLIISNWAGTICLKKLGHVRWVGADVPRKIEANRICQKSHSDR